MLEADDQFANFIADFYRVEADTFHIVYMLQFILVGGNESTVSAIFNRL